MDSLNNCYNKDVVQPKLSFYMHKSYYRKVVGKITTIICFLINDGKVEELYAKLCWNHCYLLSCYNVHTVQFSHLFISDLKKNQELK